MTTEQLPSEAELEKLLAVDENAFFEAIYEYHARPLLGYMNRVSWGLLSKAELCDGVQTALLEFFQKVRDPEFDRREPLRMLFVIARNVAVALRRRRQRRPDLPNQEAVTQAIAADLTGTMLGFEWRLDTPERRQSLQELVVDIVTTMLPDRQRYAVLALVECYEDIRAKNKYGPIKAAMEAMTLQTETLAAVKSALRAGLATIRRELKKRGFKYAERDGV